MKRKFIIGAVLILIGLLLIWITCAPGNGFNAWWLERPFCIHRSVVIRMTPEGIWTRQLKSPWKDTRVALYRSSGDIIQLDAKEATYHVQAKINQKTNNAGFDMPMIAFVDPDTKNTWIGGEDNGETDEFGNIYTNF